jgi:hypothetical protein
MAAAPRRYDVSGAACGQDFRSSDPTGLFIQEQDLLVTLGRNLIVVLLNLAATLSERACDWGDALCQQ